MLAFKALHILSMFSAVTLLIGHPVFLALAIWRGDVGAMAAIHRLAGRWLVPTGALLFLAGIGFGLATAATGGFDFLAGWLVAAYVLVVAIFVVNGLPPVQGLLKLGEHAADAEAGRRPVDDVVREMANSRFIVGGFAPNVVLFVAIILDMVLKPF